MWRPVVEPNPLASCDLFMKSSLVFPLNIIVLFTVIYICYYNALKNVSYFNNTSWRLLYCLFIMPIIPWPQYYFVDFIYTCNHLYWHLITITYVYKFSISKLKTFNIKYCSWQNAVQFYFQTNPNVHHSWRFWLFGRWFNPEFLVAFGIYGNIVVHFIINQNELRF